VPTLPYITAQPGARPRASASAFGGGSGLSALASGLSQAAQTLSDTGERLYEAEQTSLLYKSVTDSASALRRESETIQEGDPGEAEAALRKASERIRKAGSGGLKGPYADRFTAHFTEVVSQEETRVRGWVRGRQIDSARANRDASLTQMQEMAARAKSPGERQLWRDNAFELIESTVLGGVTHAEEGEAMRQSFERGVRIADLREMLNTDPEAAVRELSDPGSDLYRLPEAERQTAIGQAADAVAQQMAAERAARKEFEAQQGEDAMKALISLAAPGGTGLTQDDVDTAAPYLSASEYKQMSEIVAKGGRLGSASGATVAQVYIDLSNRAAGGENVSRDIDLAYAHGDVSRSERDTLLKLNAGQTYGDAVRYVVEATRVGEANDDPAARLRSAEAVAQMNDWAARNPEATREDAFKKARQLSSDAVLVDLSTRELGLAKPSILSERPRTVEEVQLAERETFRAFLRHYGMPPEVADGDTESISSEFPMQWRQLMADPEFRQQAALLRKWRALMEQKAMQTPGGAP